MIIRAKAPLRIGFAGGGTDVEPYLSQFGGVSLNSTINMFAYTSIEPLNERKIIFESIDRGERFESDSIEYIEPKGNNILLKAVYNRIVKDYIKKPLNFKLITYLPVPSGSGLGSSSTLVVSAIGAFVEWLNIPISNYEIAQLAYLIEREDLKMEGGKQDQFAATFGGFNYIEFFKDGRVLVNPLRIKQEFINELEFSILLYYTNLSRKSHNIIKNQVNNVVKNKDKTIFALHKLKEQTFLMKEAILKGEYNKIGDILEFGWENKKLLTNEITNEYLDNIYNTAKSAGALGGKISGAGGGGFFIFYCPNNSKYKVIQALSKFRGEIRRFQFTKYGLIQWKI